MTARMLGLAALALASHVAVAAEIKTTVDPAAEFARYPTFSFLEPDPKAKGAITDKKVRERLRYMIAVQLNGRGYKPAAPGKTGELGVNFTGHAQPKERVFMVGRPTSPYSYGWGQTDLGGTDSLNYREGRLIVDLVDIANSKLLWRAHIEEALTAGYSEENWKKAERALADAFKKLPAPR